MFLETVYYLKDKGSSYLLSTSCGPAAALRCHIHNQYLKLVLACIEIEGFSWTCSPWFQRGCESHKIVPSFFFCVCVCVCVCSLCVLMFIFALGKEALAFIRVG